MRAALLAAGAVLVVCPATAQPAPPGGAHPLGRSPDTLTDMEAHCRAGRPQACEEAERLRARVQSGLRATQGGTAGGAAAPGASPGGAPGPADGPGRPGGTTDPGRR
jgi:hypothetical protein